MVKIHIKPNDPLDYCRKIAGCGIAEEGTPCPLWLAFLYTVTRGDYEMIEYLRRVCDVSAARAPIVESAW